MTSDAWLRVLSVVIWASIVAMWAWWVRSRVQRRRHLRGWPRVDAHVTEARATRQSVSSDGGPSQQYTVFQVRYAFTDPSGGTQRGKHRTKKVTREGDLLEVMHDPADPSTHEPVALTTPTWAAVTLLVFFSLGLALPAVLTLFLGLGYD